MSFQGLVVLLICVGSSIGENTKKCGNKKNLRDVRIPIGQLFRLEDFNNFVMSTTLKESYVLLPHPAPFNVSRNFNCAITAANANTFHRVCTGLQPNCTKYNLTLSAVTQGKRVSFTYTDFSNNEVNDYYWSPCPDKFILRVHCRTDHLQQNHKCAKTAVFLVGDINLSNAPWNDISKEIFTATGVKFGDIDGMDWYFTESSNTPCVV